MYQFKNKIVLFGFCHNRNKLNFRQLLHSFKIFVRFAVRKGFFSVENFTYQLFDIKIVRFGFCHNRNKLHFRPYFTVVKCLFVSLSEKPNRSNEMKK